MPGRQPHEVYLGWVDPARDYNGESTVTGTAVMISRPGSVRSRACTTACWFPQFASYYHVPG
jgi:hypothetical protein